MRADVAASPEPSAPGVEQRLTAIEARLRAVERRGGIRDGCDLALLVALHTLVGRGDFGAAAVLERMRIDPAFRDVAEAAGLDDDIGTIGYWLRGQRGAVVGNATLTRQPGSRPARWAFI